MDGTISELVLSQQGKNFVVAFEALNSACAYAERLAKAKDRNIAEQARKRRADLDWNAIKVLAQDFVDRGILKPQAMDQF
jgi:hypothetical protein